MNDFRQVVSRFREAVQREGERTEAPGLQTILTRERRAVSLRLRWAAAVVVMLAVIPVYQNVQRQREAAQETADELLMEQVNAGLSRSVPRAMAPLLDWAPTGR